MGHYKEREWRNTFIVEGVLVNYEKLKDPKNVANAFNNFFLQIPEKLNIQVEEGDAISFLKDPFPYYFHSIK
jgi:hypothetical protein